MNIDEKTVEDIAHLARLEFDPQRAKELSAEMTKILGWMEKLNEINTENVEPLIHISTEVNVLRKDEVNNVLDHDAALKNAPKKDSNYFRVPKVIE